jgi:tetratricopeptide (TPR) repeat protein
MNPWQFVTAFLLGILFSWVCIKTNSILLPIFGHFLNNFLILIVQRYHNLLSIPDNILGGFQPLWLDALGVFLFVSGLILLLFSFRKFREADARTLFNLGHAYRRSGRYKEAIEAFKRSIAQKPNDAWTYYGLGFVYVQLSHLQEAIEVYQKAIRLEPDFSYAHMNLGFTYFLTGDKENTLKEYKILKKLNLKLADKLLKMIGE